MRAKGYRILYISIFLILCLIPSAGLMAGGGEDSAERENRVSRPSLFLSGSRLNVNYPAQAGAWFEENFAWRAELVSINARIQSCLGISAQEDVILGRDGWLYYRESLNDYTGSSQLSDRTLYDIAHTAAMTQEYCMFTGAEYLFVVVPDKVTLYPEHLPYYYAHKVSDSSNRVRLKKFMEQEGVHYLDLTDQLQEAVLKSRQHSEDWAFRLPSLYHRTDSHWTNEGAAVGADAILTELNTEHIDYLKADAEIKTDFTGDLETMLYPAFPSKEEEVYYNPPPAYGYLNEVKSTYDYFIQTVSGGNGQSLLMYRDSFANALLPFLAENFSGGYFSRAVPADLLFDMNSCAPTAVVMEHAERNIPGTAAPSVIMQALPSSLTPEDPELLQTDARIECETEEANPYFTKVSGTFDTAPDAGVRIYTDPGDGILYEAMPVFWQDDNKEGFLLYFPADTFPASQDLCRQVRVYLTSK